MRTLDQSLGNICTRLNEIQAIAVAHNAVRIKCKEEELQFIRRCLLDAVMDFALMGLLETDKTRDVITHRADVPETVKEGIGRIFTLFEEICTLLTNENEAGSHYDMAKKITALAAKGLNEFDTFPAPANAGGVQ
jgi:hypothetical protein